MFCFSNKKSCALLHLVLRKKKVSVIDGPSGCHPLFHSWKTGGDLIARPPEVEGCKKMGLWGIVLQRFMTIGLGCDMCWWSRPWFMTLSSCPRGQPACGAGALEVLGEPYSSPPERKKATQGECFLLFFARELAEHATASRQPGHSPLASAWALQFFENYISFAAASLFQVRFFCMILTPPCSLDLTGFPFLHLTWCSLSKLHFYCLLCLSFSSSPLFRLILPDFFPVLILVRNPLLPLLISHLPSIIVLLFVIRCLLPNLLFPALFRLTILWVLNGLLKWKNVSILKK